jgi:hypothetical protein
VCVCNAVIVMEYEGPRGMKKRREFEKLVGEKVRLFYVYKKQNYMCVMYLYVNFFGVIRVMLSLTVRPWGHQGGF